MPHKFIEVQRRHSDCFLTTEINEGVYMYRGNATRVRCNITNAQMLQQIERYLKQHILHNKGSAPFVPVPPCPPPPQPQPQPQQKRTVCPLPYYRHVFTAPKTA